MKLSAAEQLPARAKPFTTGRLVVGILIVTIFAMVFGKAAQSLRHHSPGKIYYTASGTLSERDLETGKTRETDVRKPASTPRPKSMRGEVFAESPDGSERLVQTRSGVLEIDGVRGRVRDLGIRSQLRTAVTSRGGIAAVTGIVNGKLGVFVLDNGGPPVKVSDDVADTLFWTLDGKHVIVVSNGTLKCHEIPSAKVVFTLKVDPGKPVWIQ